MRDVDVRSALVRDIARRHAGDPDTIIVEEMGVWSGSVRVDVAVVNSELHGFEIKSDRDTLARLPAQAMLYNQVFDRITLVAGSRHWRKVIQIVPEWWGIAIARKTESGVDIIIERGATCNPSPDPLMIARLVWRREAIAILDRHGAARGWRSASADRLHHRLAEVLPLDVLRAEVRRCLKERIAEWSRKIRPYALDVPADADGNPRLQVSG